MIDLKSALIGYADWIGYGHAERADAWLQRLQMNAAELASFNAQPHSSAVHYRARPATLLPPNGNISASTSTLVADASAALKRAIANSHLNAFTWIADSAPSCGPGFLSGVPIVIKDLMAVKGVPLTGGSRATEGEPAEQDAEVVARLKRAGAAVIATTNLHELAYGVTSDNPHFGRVQNPAAPICMPGGSSGGSAAAISAGIVKGAIGTDTAGSIRVPAACCGVVGFKPSYDVLPRAGIMDLAPSLDHVGPMGNSVATCATLFAAMLDLHAEPQWAWRDLSGCHIVRLIGYFEQPLDPEVRAVLDNAIDALTGDLAYCTESEIEGVELSAALQFNTICAEASEVHARLLQLRAERLGEDVRVRLEIGNFLPGPWYVKAQRLRTKLAEHIDALFEHADFLICPTMRAPAPAIGAVQVEIGGHPYPLHTAVTNLTMPFNLVGLPAITVPWGRSAAGVPIGLQLVGKRGTDWQLLAVAARLEAVRGTV
jgi:Asp-tRNA(Asn)/Glu-tRNA(Gln) amidotransferase A subunit family amidase